MSIDNSLLASKAFHLDPEIEPSAVHWVALSYPDSFLFDIQWAMTFGLGGPGTWEIGSFSFSGKNSSGEELIGWSTRDVTRLSPGFTQIFPIYSDRGERPRILATAELHKTLVGG
jgi:hypothetical protein